MRYVMKQKMLSLRDSFAIRSQGGDEVYQVKGKLISIGDKLTMYRGGEEVASIREQVVSLVPRYRIYRGGKLQAEVKKRAFSLLKDRLKIDMKDGSRDMEIVGNLLDHEYSIRRGMNEVARVSKRWLSLRDSYGIEIDPGEDDVLILACAVVIDMILHDQDQNERPALRE